MSEITIAVNGYERTVDFEACVMLMDDELREQTHRELAPCSEQEFINRYCELHAEKWLERGGYRGC